jgi:hypothetical protein
MLAAAIGEFGVETGDISWIPERDFMGIFSCESMA